MRSNGKITNWSGEGELAKTWILFIIFFGLFLGSVYALSFWDFDTVWIPGLICLGLLTLVFFVTKGIMGVNRGEKEFYKDMEEQPRSRKSLY